MTRGFPPSPAMAMALEAARKAAEIGEVPIGAALVGPGGDVIAVAGNRTIIDRDPTAHAEMLVIRDACKQLGTERLTGCDLFVTLEPCPMCAAAISFARIRRLYYGASDPKGGGIEQGPRIFAHPTCHHQPEIYSGIADKESAALLRAFFQARR